MPKINFYKKNLFIIPINQFLIRIRNKSFKIHLLAFFIKKNKINREKI